MSIYGLIAKETVHAFEPAPVTNDTLIGDYSSYLRWSIEESTYQMSSKIDPRTEGEGVWTNIPSSVYDAIHPEGGGKTLTIGQLITRLSQQEQMHYEEVKAHNKLRAEAQDAIRIIGERLISESEDRDWCAEFDTIIDDVNGSLPAWGQLPDRTREYTVTWSEEYRVTVQRETTVTARSEADAISIAQEYDEADGDEVANAARYNGVAYDCDNSDYEAEVA
jgi:hypothetical protein